MTSIKPEDINKACFLTAENEAFFLAPLWLDIDTIRDAFQSDAFLPSLEEAHMRLKEIYQKYNTLLHKYVEENTKGYDPVYLATGAPVFEMACRMGTVEFVTKEPYYLVNCPCPDLRDSSVSIEQRYSPIGSGDMPNMEVKFGPDNYANRATSEAVRDGSEAVDLVGLVYGNAGYTIQNIDVDKKPKPGGRFIKTESLNEKGSQRIYIRLTSPYRYPARSAESRQAGIKETLEMAELFYDTVDSILTDFEEFCAKCIDAVKSQESQEGEEWQA